MKYSVYCTKCNTSWCHQYKMDMSGRVTWWYKTGDRRADDSVDEEVTALKKRKHV
jgi:hypothetical protein